jgi:hypothetical protein
MLVGVALKYAELPPVPVETTPEAVKLFEEQVRSTWNICTRIDRVLNLDILHVVVHC